MSFPAPWPSPPSLRSVGRSVVASRAHVAHAQKRRAIFHATYLDRIGSPLPQADSASARGEEKSTLENGKAWSSKHHFLPLSCCSIGSLLAGLRQSKMQKRKCCSPIDSAFQLGKRATFSETVAKKTFCLLCNHKGKVSSMMHGASGRGIDMSFVVGERNIPSYYAPRYGTKALSRCRR